MGLMMAVAQGQISPCDEVDIATWPEVVMALALACCQADDEERPGFEKILSEAPFDGSVDCGGAVDLNGGGGGNGVGREGSSKGSKGMQRQSSAKRMQRQSSSVYMLHVSSFS